MSNILVSDINDFKLYNLSKGRTLQELLSSVKNNLKLLKKNDEYTNRIELIQEFNFKTAGSCIKLTDDGSHIFAAGVYAPRLKIFDLKEMSLKVERGLDSEVVKIATISDDYTKCALLLEDRNIEIHAQYGKHFSIRIPKFGRDMIYNKYQAELLTCGSGNEIYRLNLNEGSFMKQYETGINGINCIRHNPFLNILGACGEDGKLEIWDINSNSRSAHLPDTFNSTNEFSSMEFSDFYLSLGTANGHISTFDLRYPKPLYTIKHPYKKPIHTIKYHQSSESLITVDKKMIKFTNIKTGELISNVEANNDINDFEICPGTGMFFTANESPKLEIYFAPKIGNAPQWCSFLEKITEELEENNNTSLSADKKFLDMKNLEELSCTNLIGTKFLTPYMHGYFMDMKMYKKLKALIEPFNYEKFLENKKQESMNKLLGNRIIVKKREPKVNENMIGVSIDNITVEDSRFSKLFNNTDYTIDKNSSTFKQKKLKEKSGLLKGNTNKILQNEIEQQYGEFEQEELDLKEKKDDNMIVSNKILEIKEKMNKKREQKSFFKQPSSKSLGENVKELITQDLHTLQSSLKQKMKIYNHKSQKKDKLVKIESNKEGRRLLFK